MDIHTEGGVGPKEFFVVVDQSWTYALRGCGWGGRGSSNLFKYWEKENRSSMDLGDCMANSHAALTKSLRGKLSKLVIFLLARETEASQNWTFGPPPCKFSPVKHYLSYICSSKLQTLIGMDLQINITHVKTPMSTLYPFWGGFTQNRSSLLEYYRRNHLCSCNTCSCLGSLKRNTIQINLCYQPEV